MADQGSHRRMIRYDDEIFPDETSAIEKFDQKLLPLLTSVLGEGLGEVYEHKLPKEDTLEVVPNKAFDVNGHAAKMDFALCLSNRPKSSVWAAGDGRVYIETVTDSERKAKVFPKNTPIKLQGSLTWPRFYRMNFRYPLSSSALALVRLDIVRAVRWAAKKQVIPGIDDIVFPNTEKVIEALREYPSASRPSKVSTPSIAQTQPADQQQLSSGYDSNAVPAHDFMPPKASGSQPLPGPHTHNVSFSSLVHRMRPGETYLPDISDYGEFEHRPEPTPQLQKSPPLHAPYIAVPLPSALAEDNQEPPQTASSSEYFFDLEDNISEAATPVHEPVVEQVIESLLAASPQSSTGVASSGSAAHLEPLLSRQARDLLSDAHSQPSSKGLKEHSSGRIFDYPRYYCGQHHCTLDRLDRNVGPTQLSYLPKINIFQFADQDDEDFMSVRLRLGECLPERSEIWHELWVFLKPTLRTYLGTKCAPDMEFVRVVPCTTAENRQTVKINGGIAHGQIMSQIAKGSVRLRGEFEVAGDTLDKIKALVKYALVLGVEKGNIPLRDHRIPINSTFEGVLNEVCEDFKLGRRSRSDESASEQSTKHGTANNITNTVANIEETGTESLEQKVDAFLKSIRITSWSNHASSRPRENDTMSVDEQESRDNSHDNLTALSNILANHEQPVGSSSDRNVPVAVMLPPTGTIDPHLSSSASPENMHPEMAITPNYDHTQFSHAHLGGPSNGVYIDQAHSYPATNTPVRGEHVDSPSPDGFARHPGGDFSIRAATERQSRQSPYSGNHVDQPSLSSLPVRTRQDPESRSSESLTDDVTAVVSAGEPSSQKKHKSKVNARQAPSPKTSHHVRHRNGKSRIADRVLNGRVGKHSSSSRSLNSKLIEALKESNRIRSTVRLHADEREKASHRREMDLERMLMEANRDRRQAEDDRREVELSLDKMTSMMEQLFEQMEEHVIAESSDEEDGDLEMEDTGDGALVDVEDEEKE